MNRQERIIALLSEAFHPHVLYVDNESFRHHVPEGSETHFKLVVVSDIFKDLNRVARHRQVNKILAPELAQGLHALSMHLYTPLEWEKEDATAPQSPACRDGYRHG